MRDTIEWLILHPQVISGDRLGLPVATDRLHELLQQSQSTPELINPLLQCSNTTAFHNSTSLSTVLVLTRHSIHG